MDAASRCETDKVVKWLSTVEMIEAYPDDNFAEEHGLGHGRLDKRLSAALQGVRTGSLSAGSSSASRSATPTRS